MLCSLGHTHQERGHRDTPAAPAAGPGFQPRADAEAAVQDCPHQALGTVVGKWPRREDDQELGQSLPAGDQGFLNTPDSAQTELQTWFPKRPGSEHGHRGQPSTRLLRTQTAFLPTWRCPCCSNRGKGEPRKLKLLSASDWRTPGSLCPTG